MSLLSHASAVYNTISMGQYKKDVLGLSCINPSILYWSMWSAAVSKSEDNFENSKVMWPMLCCKAQYRKLYYSNGGQAAAIWAGDLGYV